MTTAAKRLALLEEQANQPPPKREPPIDELRKRAAEAAINGTLHWNNLQLQTPLPAVVPIPSNVFHLKLGNNEFVEFPKEVLALRQLQVLEINANLMAAVPAQISALETLHTLYLNNNRVGKLPPEIGKLTNLQMLDVHGNRLNEVPLELCWCTALTKLNVSDNMLRMPFQRIEHVSIPDLLALLKIMLVSQARKELHMVQSDIDLLQSSAMEQAHRLCTVITSLYLPFVEVGEVTDLIQDFAPLKLLCFGGCKIHRVSPAIGALSSKLRFIDLRRNDISTFPDGFGGLANLATLLLDDNKLQVFPKSLLECKALTHLSLRCNVLEEVPPEFGGLANLKVWCTREALVHACAQVCMCALSVLACARPQGGSRSAHGSQGPSVSQTQRAFLSIMYLTWGGTNQDFPPRE
jgi:Leucine-rich repeat (LRR) protein